MITDNKVHVANIGPTWVLLVPGGPNVGPMNFAIRDVLIELEQSEWGLTGVLPNHHKPGSGPFY